MPPAADAITGFDGGANLRDAINQLGRNEARSLLNMILDERGGASKRLGSEKLSEVGVAADRIISLYPFYRGDDPVQLLAETDAGKLYYTTDLIAWTEITTGLDTTNPMTFETFNSKVYMVNGVDDYAWWDGATFSTDAALPKGKFIRLWKDTMWVSGVTGFEDRVYSSDPANAESYPALGFVDVAKGDGDRVSALDSDGTFLIVPKFNRAWVIYDPVTYANRLFDFEKGAESHFSFIHHEGDIFYLSRKGFCRFLGDSPSELISDKIDPLFVGDVLNIDKLNLAWGYVHENRVGWSLPEVSELAPTLQVEYYPRLERKPWAFHRMPARCFARWRKAEDDIVVFGDTGDNSLDQAFASVGQDNGTTFNGIIELGFLDMQNPLTHKYLKRLRVLARGKFLVGVKRDFENAVIKTYSIDLTGDTDLWDPADTWDAADLWGPTAWIKEQLVNVDHHGRFFSLRFSDAETTTGTKPFDVGDREYLLTRGQWAVFGTIFEGEMLGVRS